MNIKELKSALKEKNISPDAYSIDESGAHLECYCLSNESSCWSIYYSERGQKTGYRQFSTESEACKYFYALITKDQTTNT